MNVSPHSEHHISVSAAAAVAAKPACDAEKSANKQRANATGAGGRHCPAPEAVSKPGRQWVGAVPGTKPLSAEPSAVDSETSARHAATC